MKIAIGQNIRKLRLARGMTQRYLACHLSVTPQTVSKWEREGSFPDPYLLLKIASLFDVSLDDLFGRGGATE